jgi:hypothetical protein
LKRKNRHILKVCYCDNLGNFSKNLKTFQGKSIGTVNRSEVAMGSRAVGSRNE